MHALYRSRSEYGPLSISKLTQNLLKSFLILSKYFLKFLG